MIFLEADLSQAEARIVAHLANDTELLTLFDTVDIHKLTASWFFNVDPSAVNGEMRFIGKTGRHGGNYDMGKRRLMFTINTQAYDAGINVHVSEYRAGQILEIFHKKSPNIRNVFHRDVIEALEHNNRILVNPFGFTRQFLERWNDNLFKEAYAHIPQSTVRDHMIGVMLRLYKRCPELQVLIEAHDSITAQVPESRFTYYAEIIKEEMEKEIDFTSCTLSRGKLKIPAEVMRGRNLKSLEKVKI